MENDENGFLIGRKMLIVQMGIPADTPIEELDKILAQIRTSILLALNKRAVPPASSESQEPVTAEMNQDILADLGYKSKESK